MRAGPRTGRRAPGEPRRSRRHARRGARRARERLRGALYGNAALLGTLSLAWLLMRSVRKPSRLNYPCQRAALANTALLFGGTAVPVAARLPRLLWRRRVPSPRARRAVRLCEAAGTVALAALLAWSLAGSRSEPGRPLDEMKATAASLAAPGWRSASAGASDIFVAQDIPTASELGVDRLIDVMSCNGLDFFESGGTGRAAGPGGIIGADDVVLIKVNGEWRQRGGTNTDVVKGLVNAVVHHPDGFTGEVVIVENGQWASYMDNLPNNRNPDQCNAEDRTQSYNDVANIFAGSHRVSVYDWTQVQTRSVEEFGSGDMRDGYCYVPEIQEGYPKFTTVYGTRVSLRHGVFDGAAYDNSRLKFVNVPVLKDHGGPGVTCCVKHFMGVQDLWKGTQDPPHTPMVTEGIFGKLMLVARFPDLNVVDAVWVTPTGGPNGPYASAVRVNKLLAGTDPVALDCYAARNVLMPLSGSSRHDPYAPNQFNQMMRTTRDVLVAGGRRATMDPGMMNVYTGTDSEPPPTTPHEQFLAEGSTAWGFETWLLVANTNDQAATVHISYMTDAGCRNRAPVTVPSRSRLTLNASADIWSLNSGIRVGSDVPVGVERAMYWGERAEGHASAASPSADAEWYLADGHTADGFETWIEILNPGAAEAAARLTYMTPGGAVPGPCVEVPAYSRRTVFAADTVPGSDVSTKVEADRPVVVERSMYWGGRRGGCGAMGVSSRSRQWYLAEGCTGWGFETWVLIMNPNTVAADVSLELSTPAGGAPLTRRLEVPPCARRTVRLNDIVGGTNVSTRVRADVEVVVERTMLWPAPGGRAGHTTVGTTTPSDQVFMPEGCTAYGFETWLLLLNPGTEESRASVYAMTAAGERKLTDVAVPPGACATLKLNDYYQGNLSIRLEATQPVVCERSIYWNDRTGGTSCAAPGIAPPGSG